MKKHKLIIAIVSIIALIITGILLYVFIPHNMSDKDRASFGSWHDKTADIGGKARMQATLGQYRWSVPDYYGSEIPYVGLSSGAVNNYILAQTKNEQKEFAVQDPLIPFGALPKEGALPKDDNLSMVLGKNVLYDEDYKKGDKGIYITNIIPIESAWKMGADKWDEKTRRNFHFDLSNTISYGGKTYNFRSTQPNPEMVLSMHEVDYYAQSLVYLKKKYNLIPTQENAILFNWAQRYIDNMVNPDLDPEKRLPYGKFYKFKDINTQASLWQEIFTKILNKETKDFIWNETSRSSGNVSSYVYAPALPIQILSLELKNYNTHKDVKQLAEKIKNIRYGTASIKTLTDKELNSLAAYSGCQAKYMYCPEKESLIPFEGYKYLEEAAKQGYLGGLLMGDHYNWALNYINATQKANNMPIIQMTGKSMEQTENYIKLTHQ